MKQIVRSSFALALAALLLATFAPVFAQGGCSGCGPDASNTSIPGGATLSLGSVQNPVDPNRTDHGELRFTVTLVSVDSSGCTGTSSSTGCDSHDCKVHVRVEVTKRLWSDPEPEPNASPSPPAHAMESWTYSLEIRIGGEGLPWRDLEKETEIGELNDTGSEELDPSHGIHDKRYSITCGGGQRVSVKLVVANSAWSSHTLTAIMACLSCS